MQFLVLGSRALIGIVTDCAFSYCKWVGAPQHDLCNISSEDSTQIIHDSSFSWRQPTYTQMCTKQRQHMQFAFPLPSTSHFLKTVCVSSCSHIRLLANSCCRSCSVTPLSLQFRGTSIFTRCRAHLRLWRSCTHKPIGGMVALTS